MGSILALLMASQRGTFDAGLALDTLRADPRIDALRLSDDQLRTICQHECESLPALLTAIATMRIGRRPAAILFKLESLLYTRTALYRIFPDAVTIHILRDPRAVASSMLRTPVPEKPGFTMARGSLLYAARHWRTYIATVDALARERPVAEVRYESLAAGDMSSLDEVAATLGLGPPSNAALGEGRYVVSELDRTIHDRIGDRLQVARADAWRTELSSNDVRVIERTCAAGMRVHGYSATLTPAGRFSMLFIGAELRHLRAMAWHIIRTAHRYAMRPDALTALAARLQLALLARRNY